MRFPHRLFSLAALVILFTWATTPILSVLAQTASGGWSDPVNVSRSGGATDPILAVDEDNVVHLLWKDSFDGYQYANSSVPGWTTPVRVNVPFPVDASEQLILSDSRPSLHSLWIDENGRLLYSVARVRSMGLQASWQRSGVLGSAVTEFSATIDANDQVHVVYVQSADLGESPAGIYYIRIEGTLRTTPVRIFESPYFRAAEEEGIPASDERPQADLDITTAQDGDQEIITILWSLPQAKRVYLARSQDGGRLWDGVIELDTPEGMPGSAVPESVKLGSLGEQVIAFWQVAQPEGGCQAYYRTSDDGGVDWEARAALFPGVNGCLENSRYYATENNSLLLYTEINEVVSFAIWDGSSWGTPQMNGEFSEFADPNTLNSVSLSCYHPFLSGDTMYISGCDRGIGGDVWVTSMPAAGIVSGDDTALGWSRPRVVDAASAAYFSPVLLSSGQDFHAFWSLPNDLETPDYGSEIAHSTWRAEGAISTTSVLQSPTGRAEPLSVVLDDEGQLLAAWNGGVSGEVYFSQAPANTSRTPSDWSKPVRVPDETEKAFHPVIQKDRSGNLFVLYAIPVNEERGVYLTRSTDLGRTWSSPVQVLDGSAQGCELINQLDLGVTGSGKVTVMWVCQTQPDGVGSLALWTAQSEDGGVSFSDPVMVSDARVLWSQLVATQGETVHLLWREYSKGRSHLWHSMSGGDGIWSLPQEIVSLDGEIGPSYAALDSAQQVYLLQFSGGATRPTINYWVWDGSEWQTGQPAELPDGSVNTVAEISAVVSEEGQLGILFAGSSYSANPNRQTLYFVSRSVEVPAEPVVEIMTAPPLSTAAPEPTSEASVLATDIVPTATPDLMAINATVPPAPPQSSWGGLVIGALLVLGLIAGVFFADSRLKLRR